MMCTSFKISPSIDVTKECMVISTNDAHPSNKLFPIVVIEEGKRTLESDLQSLNVQSSIEIVDEGIVIFYNEMHLSKDLSAIEFTKE